MKQQRCWRARQAAGLVLAASLVMGACSKHRAAEDPSAQEAPAAVSVAKASRENLSRDLVLTAEFRPFQEIDVMAKVSGYVKQIRVDVGDLVSQGQLLAVIEIPEMLDDQARADAAIKRYRADHEHARDELRRAESAHEIAHLQAQRLSEVVRQRPGLMAQQEIDDAKSRDVAAEAQIAAAGSAVASAEEQVRVVLADRAKLKTLYDYTRVTAPFTGIVTKRYVDHGAMVQAGTSSQARPVVRLSENGLLRLILPVPESAVAQVRRGAQVEVRVPVLNRTFAGKVARTSERLELSTRTMETEVDVPNPNLSLVPGMYAEVTLGLQERKNTLAIPPEAVAGTAETSSVYLVTGEHKIEERRVALGLATAGRVEVLSGLRPDDLVVIAGRAQLTPGQSVMPKLVQMSTARGVRQ